MELGKSKEDYLKTIYILQLKSSNVHSVNIAEYMGVSKASVSVAMKQLRSKNLLKWVFRLKLLRKMPAQSNTL